jgi:CRISPR-associated protein Cas5t
MEFYRIKITSWTSSFKFPNIISGFQPTLVVPPISTILGIFNSAAGKYLKHKNLKLGYYFEFGSKNIDLETIYQFSNLTNVAKANIIQREFLFDNTLFIYLESKDQEIIEYLQNPYYQILLGRMNDIATIEDIELVKLKSIVNANKIKGQIIPFNNNFLQGLLQPLPKYFSDTLPRYNIGTEPYSIIDFKTEDFKTNMNAYRDEEISKNFVDIYFHELNFTDE